jgi:NADH dehydrogenase FAD-containing subunit
MRACHPHSFSHCRSVVAGRLSGSNMARASSTVGLRSRVPYDSLIVAAGAGESYFGHDEFAVFAPGGSTRRVAHVVDGQSRL